MSHIAPLQLQMKAENLELRLLSKLVIMDITAAERAGLGRQYNVGTVYGQPFQIGAAF